MLNSFSESPPGSINAHFFVSVQNIIGAFCANGVTGLIIAFIGI